MLRKLLSEQIKLAAGAKRTTVTVTRTGSFTDPRYGRFEITKPMLLSMVANFQNNVYGQEIFLDVAHKPENGSAAKIVSLSVDGDKLLAEVEWTPEGIKAVQEKGYSYLSAEYHDNFKDNEKGDSHGPTLLGAALTIRPVIKRLDPIQLSEQNAFIHNDLIHQLSEEVAVMLKDILKKLKKQLSDMTLTDPVISSLIEAFTLTAKALGEDNAALELMLAQYVDTGKKLAAATQDTGQGSQATDGLAKQLAEMQNKQLSADDVTKLLNQAMDGRDDAAKKLQTDKQSNIDLFNKQLEEAKGLETLSEPERKSLAAAADLITAEMTVEQVKQLAMLQISQANRLVAAKQLGSMGYEIPGAAGSVRISVDDSNNIKALQEKVDERLGIKGQSESRRFANTGGKLLEENKVLVDKVLAQYDSEHGPQLHREHKMLAGGDGIVSDVDVPASWERTVLREALYQLVGLQFVNSGTMAFNTSAFIPYSYRDTAASGKDNTRVYEGGSIPRAGVIQTSETAYPIPQKIAFEVSDELRLLTGARHINWDAVAENQQNASRIIREDLEALIFNEVLRSADEFGAVAISSEALTARVDGTDKVFILAQFPVIRPRSVFDLQGSQVGSTVNPIVVNYGGSARLEYDGTGTQAAGTYYVINYNPGEIYFVDESGAIITPPNATVVTVSYSYASNRYNFDTDEGSVAIDVHWDTFLYRYGLRKSIVEDDRYFNANFGLMSGNAMTQIEQAKKFDANSRRPGTDLAMDGNLNIVKGVPNFKTTAPGLHMGDSRVLIGERGQTRLRMMKPWTMGEMENQKDANGRFTGKKEAYGDQFLILHTPTQLKRANTTINLYSATARVDRAAL